MARKDRKRRRQRFVLNREHGKRHVPKPSFYRIIVKHFPVAVDPNKLRVYNYDGTVREVASRPAFGYCCPECGIAGSDIWHFWVTDITAVCSECARRHLVFTDDNLIST